MWGRVHALCPDASGGQRTTPMLSSRTHPSPLRQNLWHAAHQSAQSVEIASRRDTPVSASSILGLQAQEHVYLFHIDSSDQTHVWARIEPTDISPRPYMLHYICYFTCDLFYSDI